MNPLMIVTFIRYGIYAVIGIAFAYVIYSINHTYSENKQLKSDAIVQAGNVKTLNDSIDTQKKINVSLQARIKQVQDSKTSEIVYVDKAKKGDVIYAQKIKKEASDIKATKPETLDHYYISKYNTILDCISNITTEKGLICSVQ